MAGSELSARKPQAAAVLWRSPSEGLPNDTEVLLQALLLLDNEVTASETQVWAAEVQLRYVRCGSAEPWPPAGTLWKSVGGQPAPLYKTLQLVTCEGGGGDRAASLERI